jgi:hypothetical protein
MPRSWGGKRLGTMSGTGGGVGFWIRIKLDRVLATSPPPLSAQLPEDHCSDDGDALQSPSQGLPLLSLAVSLVVRGLNRYPSSHCWRMFCPWVPGCLRAAVGHIGAYFRPTALVDAIRVGRNRLHWIPGNS